jgi:HEAT repeat protein
MTLTSKRIIERLQVSFKDRHLRWRRSNRHRAWDVQRQIAKHSATKDLVQALQDCDDVGVRRLLCYTLGHRGAKEAVPILLDILSIEDLRFDAADALLDIGDSRACESFLDFFEKESTKGMRRLYALALGTCSCRQGASALVKALKDVDAAVRGYAAQSLGMIGAKETEPYIREALAAEHSDYDSTLMGRGLELLHQNPAE